MPDVYFPVLDQFLEPLVVVVADHVVYIGIEGASVLVSCFLSKSVVSFDVSVMFGLLGLPPG